MSAECGVERSEGRTPTRSACRSCSRGVMLVLFGIISASGDGVCGIQPSICRVSGWPSAYLGNANESE